jgi:putative ABC transport system substrate-binding protein
VVGFVNVSSAKGHAQQLSAFLEGLDETGYVDGRNVAIEYRWAEDRSDRLPAMVADLVHRQVAVIAATTTSAALAAKAATTTIPIVFEIADDPVRLGLVASLDRPGGNITGIGNLNIEIVPKRLQLLHEVIPTAKVLALLVNPANSTVAETQSREALSAANALGLELHILKASTERDFDAVFANLIQLRVGGLVVAADPLFSGRSKHLGELTVCHAIPAIFHLRDFVAAGGLLSYGADTRNAYRLAGKDCHGTRPRCAVGASRRCNRMNGLMSASDPNGHGLMHCMSPLLAQSGHPKYIAQCLLLGVKRT